MNIIYIHGLDSGANSTKGLLLEQYCDRYHPEINVLRPDLNTSPEQVCEQLLSLIGRQSPSSHTALIGSSLGGYFATLLSNQTGHPALLLNPSSQPHVTLQRFSCDASAQTDQVNSEDSQILYTTVGGWHMTRADLQWFADNPLQSVIYPQKVAAFIKAGDELLDPAVSTEFYQKQGVVVTVQAGGDHRFSDFEAQLPMMIATLQQRC